MKYFEILPEDNFFKVIYVDASHRCNMNCHNCFIPNRTPPDLDIEKYKKFLSKLNGRIEVRLLGGEPTMNNNLETIIADTRKAGHSVTLVTNGLKLANMQYVKSLKDAGLREVNISMNGGTDRKLYEQIDNLDCLDQKMNAVDNVAQLKLRLRLGAILMKGVNDFVPTMLNSLALKYDVATTLNFRNVAQVGRYTLTKNENHTFEDMVLLVCNQLGYDYENAIRSNVVNAIEQERIVLFSEKIKTKNSKRKHDVWIKVTDWSPPGADFPDPNSSRRGRLTQNYQIAPFFEHVKKNENIF
jgi:molybdenum cofactor biosynthesis enzyme MoaA